MADVLTCIVHSFGPYVYQSIIVIVIMISLHIMQ